MAESGTPAPEMDMGFVHEALYAVICGSIVLSVLIGGMCGYYRILVELRRTFTHSPFYHNEGWCIAWVAVIKRQKFVKEILSLETFDTALEHSLAEPTHARNLTAKT